MQLSARKDLDVSIPVDPDVLGLQPGSLLWKFLDNSAGTLQAEVEKGIFVRMECRSKVQVLNMSIVNL